MKTLIILKTILTILLFSCSNNSNKETIIKGQYKISPKLKIRSASLYVYLANMGYLKYLGKFYYDKTADMTFKKVMEKINEMNKNGFYKVPTRVRMTSNGDFQVKVKVKGEHGISIFIDYIKNYTDKDIEMSNHYQNITTDIKEGKINKLNDLFMSEPINISAPKYNNTYKKENLAFEWNKLYFADFYDLFISKVNRSQKVREHFEKVKEYSENDKEVNNEVKLKKHLDKFTNKLNKMKKGLQKMFKTIIRIYTLKANKVSYKDFYKIRTIKETDKSPDDGEPYKDMFKELTPGEYALQVNAYKYVGNKKRIIKIANSSTSFFIKK